MGKKVKSQQERFEEFKAFMQIIPQSPKELDEQMTKINRFIKDNPDLVPFLLVEARKFLTKGRKFLEEGEKKLGDGL